VRRFLDRSLALLRAPRLALAVLAFVATWSGVGAWASWARGGAPASPVVVMAGLDRPFSSGPFLVAVALLFASTLACTLSRLARPWRLWRGELPGAVALERRRAGDALGFLRARGLRGPPARLARARAGVWGDLVFHGGVLLLIAGVFVQQALHDGAAFRLTAGEAVDLAAPGVISGLERGPLAPTTPPTLVVELRGFDAFRRQAGYAPDRASSVVLRSPAGEQVEVVLDRAAGVRLGGVDVFQTVNTGIALVVALPDGAREIVKLNEGPDRRTAAAEIVTEAGARALLTARSERRFDDARETGALHLEVETGGARAPLVEGGAFVVGGQPLRLVEITRWTALRYARDPGIPLVFGGFALVLLGSLLLALPVAVARVAAPGEPVAAWVWAPRGLDALKEEWAAADEEPPAATGTDT
jgi:cytochrome c biogenesis protein